MLSGVVLIWLDRNCLSPRLQSHPKSEDQRISYDLHKYHGKTFEVVKAVDGDTMDIGIADGQYEHTRIRLWGIDAPESKSPKVGVMYFGPEASNFAAELVRGKQVTIYLDEQRTRGKYGRLLAYMRLPDGRCVNEVLLGQGYAYADLRFHHGFYRKYQQLEASARSLKKGLWQSVTRRQLPQWLRDRKPKLLAGQ